MKVQLIQKAAVATFAGSLAFSTCVSAVNLTEVPLVVAEVAPPNIMILFDTSGSMQHVTPGGAYDSNDSTWNTCPSSSSNVVGLNSWDRIRLEITSGGYPRIDVDGSEYFYSDDENSVSADTNSARDRSFVTGSRVNRRGQTIFSYETERKACFDPNVTYTNVELTTTSYPTGSASYTGHYLNYYFGSKLDGSWVNGAEDTIGSRVHPDQLKRVEVGKTVINNFIDARDDDSINLGITRFNPNNNGALIVEGISLLTGPSSTPTPSPSTGHKGAVKAAMNNFTADGNTPIAESMIDIGGYFLGPYGQSPATPSTDSNPLITHPGTPSEQVRDVSDVFKRGRNNSLPSPIEQAAFCEKNFIIAMTDGLPTNDSTDIGSVFQNYLNDGGTDQHMDDVAQALYEMDIRPDVDNFTQTQEYLNNIKTYLIGFADPGIQNSQLFLDTANAGSGGATGPYFPTSLDELNTSFEQIIADIFAQEGSVASVSFNSGQLASDSAVFQAKFNTNPWSGNLVAFNLDDITGVIQTPFIWDAAVTLDQRANPAGAFTATEGRNVFTYDPTPGSGAADGTSLALANWANLPHELKADLYAGLDIDGDSDAADDPEAMLLLQYLLGDNSNEGAAGTNYRVRDTGQQTPVGHPNGGGLAIRNRLGDIVNSTPVFVGAPELNWPGWSASAPIKFGASGNSYSDFRNRSNIANRTPVIYVGANDGMLHGFNADLAGSGEELFAYMPSTIFSSNVDEGLHYLAQHDYAHKFYVDLTPTVSDVFITNGTTTDWRTVLVGGLRGGGRGLFALDITDPAVYGNVATPANTRAADTVLWEFTHPELGYTFSQPTIVKMANGRWAAITGNGYNSNTGYAQLFIIFLDGGVDGVWTLGTDYLVIQAGTELNNGLTSPRVADTDGDFVADRVYAGDLRGNMWVFDISTDPTVTPWAVDFSGAPLFTACDSDPCTSFNRQPITSAPILVRNPSTTTTGNEPNVLVLFGTGQFLEPTDPDTTDLQSFYSVWDAGASGLERADLAPRTLTQTTLNASLPNEVDVRTVSGTAFTYDGTTKGWFMNLPSSGERVVADPQVRGEIVFFNSIIPDDSTCSPGGTGWLMSLDYDTGLAPVNFGVFDADDDGQIDSSDLSYVGEYFGESLPAKSGLLGERQYTPGSDGSITSRAIDAGGSGVAGRLSWEEVYRQ
ncbi:hypothetical protein NBRC116493_05580 [Aurantivibrio infirmus]